ncbi:MAG TPA: condensation domain-containing protein, partial [Bryobacteraceae bacterium]
MKSDLARRLAALSPAQRDLVERRLRKKAGVDGPQSIPRRESRDNLPQSLDQERLWFVQQLDPQSAAYNIYTAVRFKGVIKHPALERALNEIVRRHEIMRTSFAAPNGRPLQIISPELQARIPLIDLLSIPPADREREAQRLAGANVSRPFDLARLPLFRAVLIQVSAEEFICPTVFHHIITDWVSFHAFDRELATLYAAFRDGKPSPLQPLPIQYADFAAWQREWLSGEVLEEQIEWWRRQLDGAPPLIDLPADRPRPPMQTPNGLRQPLVLSAVHSDGVRAMAQRHEITPFIALLTVFKLLLFRLTGHARVVVGSPIANRNRPELEDLLGFFINHLVFCTGMSGDPTFDDLLRRVRETAVGAYSHQDVPFGKLVDALRAERDLSRTPLTQVVFLFLNPEQQGEIHFSGLRIGPYMIDSESSKFDMTFSLWDGPAGYSGWIEYNPDLFDRTTILRMGQQFRTLLGWVVENGGRRISEARMLSAADRQQLVVEWNDTRLEQDSRSYVERIEEQARLRPDAPAVSDERGSVTFGELNRRGNGLARRLVREGVGLETPVGVVVDRGVELVIAWLAVGKAGGAYLAVGEGVPRARWEAMVADANAPLIVSQRHRAEGYAGRVVWMDDEPGLSENLGIPTAAENLAYVIFTSGSTGKPKGVAVEHRGLSNLMDWHLRVHGVCAGDRASQVANAGFDAAAAEIWPYLSAGASVTFAGDAQRYSPAALVEWLANERMTFCFLPTPLAEAALAEDFSQTRLRVLFTGGDRLRQRPPATLACPLWNLYGPTESTVVGTGGWVSTVGRTPASADGPLAVHSEPVETWTSRARAPGAGQGTRPTDSEGAPDIGGPIANTRAYVLDEQGGLVAIGVIGELYLGGVGLARGYLGQAAETAERFVPDAVSGEPGQRLYRTGDQVKWARDGRLVYVGRGDEQVKLRGYRIELGEVETQLGQLEGVEAAAVVLKGEGERRRLAAYVVASGVDTEALRAKLRERLPDYMVPGVISVLDELPVTTNGKIDRAALAKLEDTIVGRPGLVLPRTPAEATLARIWREVLGVAEVGVFDNLFQIGGDSILSIQIVGRARAAGLHIAPKQMFQHQTVAELAAAAHALQTVAEIGPISGPTPLTPIQLWFFEQDLAEPYHFNQAVLFEIDSPPVPAVLLHAVAELNRHHDALRTRFHRRPAGWEAEIAGASDPPFTFLDFSQISEESLFEKAAESIQRSLDLERGPMFHVAHFHYGANRPARLLIVAHHLVVDGVSWRILLEDFETACRRDALPPKTSSFRQWAARLRQYAEQDALQSEADWWRSAASGRISPLPQRTPCGENTEASAAASEFALEPDETQALLMQAGIAHRTQLQELLIFACAEALADWSGGNRVAINIEGHGREEIFDDLDLSRTVGWFTAIFPFAHDFTETADPVERLKLAKTRLRAIPRHGFGYGLHRYFRQEDLGTEAEVVFNYLGRLDASVPSGSWLRPVAENVGASRSRRNRRKYLLEIDAGIAGGRLRVRWTYSRNRHDSAEIDRLVSMCARSLRQLIGGRVPGDSLTHADFPLANLNPAQFAALVASCGVMEDVYRLSPLQEAMLFHVLSTPAPGAFCEQVDCVLAGELDTGLFQHAWRQAIQHHTILRTCFFWDEFDTPVQVVVPEAPLEIAELDWRDRGADSANEWRAFVERDRAKGFDLTRAPLMRIVLARTGESTWRCLWTCHHLLLDGWSLRMVLNDVMSIYGQHATLGAARPYADFI